MGCSYSRSGRAWSRGSSGQGPGDLVPGKLESRKTKRRATPLKADGSGVKKNIAEGCPGPEAYNKSEGLCGLPESHRLTIELADVR